MSLDVSAFASIFGAVHGHAPYLWQQRLLRRVVGGGGWPSVIAAPTGAGKTAILDIALFHLAMEADAHPRRAPLRIVFAVDRRIIVDQAFERAKTIAHELEKAPELAGMAEALKRLSGGQALHVEQLRGGMPREDDWARTPHQPTILCTTVDQLGSRLLFRGYGVSEAMAPIHAGLLGQDTLLILDEAHLSRAFATTLKAVEERQRLAECPLGLPFASTFLTATPRDDAADVFSLTDEERAEPAIARRLTARKLARLADPKAKPPKVAGQEANATAEPTAEPDPERDEAKAAPKRSDPAREAWRFVGAARELRAGLGDAPLVAVVVNRVALARAVYRALADEPDAEALLLTGRVRPAERDVLIEQYRDRLQDPEVRGPKPLFVVATQCIEAGADFDFDALATQIAPLDALAQRFGRLARTGERGGPAPAIIVALPEDIARKADDPIYGDRMRLTWDWLQARPPAEDGRVDLGPDAVAALIADDPAGAAACRADAADAPLLRAADVDFLAMTNPRPRPDPLLPLFLHGDPRIDTDVTIVWRADLTEEDLKEPERAIDIVSAMPPRPGEAVSVTIAAARRWLRRGSPPDLADVPQRDVEDDGRRAAANRQALRWRRKDPEIVTASQIRPGDTLVVPSTYGGCDAFGWSPDSKADVEDIADLAARDYRKRGFSLRLHSQVRPEGDRPPSWDVLKMAFAAVSRTHSEQLAFIKDVLAAYAVAGDEDKGRPEEATGARVATPTALARMEALEDLRVMIKRGLKPGPRLRVEWPYGEVEDAPVGAVIVVGKTPVESDDTDAGTFHGSPQGLLDHVDAVNSFAGQSVAALRLPAPIADAIRLAAHHHDDGKRDERFQLYIGGTADRPLAKSGLRRSRRADRQAWKGAGFPDLPARPPDDKPRRRPWRHEVLSVQLAAARLAAEPRTDEVDRDLVIWLIGTHHGQGRPFFRHDDPWDGEKREVGDVELPAGAGPHRLDFDWAGEDWAGLFEQLRRRYGTWGLAYLEAVLRLADHRASEAGDTLGREGEHGEQS